LIVGSERSWKRKIEIAFDTLALAYESKFVFDGIRSPMSFDYEYKDMKKKDGESDAEWNRRGPYYAILKRIDFNKDFFERAWKMQPRCTAMFGTQAEEMFLLMHRARREIEVSAQMLLWQELGHDAVVEFQRDIWERGEFEKDKDKVGKKLIEFRERVEKLCRPVIDRQYEKANAFRTLRPSALSSMALPVALQYSLTLLDMKSRSRSISSSAMAYILNNGTLNLASCG
jgi:hypothetical protein